MLKAAGLFLIVLSAGGLGFSKSIELSRRLEALEMLLRTVILLKGEIRCGNASLHDAFEGTASRVSGAYRAFFSDVAEEMERCPGSSFGDIFRKCAGRHLEQLPLMKEEQERLFSLGASLGHLDLEMQMRQLELYEQSLIRDMEELRVSLPGKKKMYQSLGILGGALLAVLVW